MRKDNTEQRKKSKDDFWQKHLDQWKKSGLSQSEYSRQNGINKNSFAWAKRRLSGKAKADRTPVFLEIPVQAKTAAADSGNLIELRIEDDQSICLRLSQKLMRGIAEASHVSR